MKTQIFKSYEDFLKREDKNINGVSEDFAAEHPTNFEKQNETNVGCWNCYDCKWCDSCEWCKWCDSCEWCEWCVSCENREN